MNQPPRQTDPAQMQQILWYGLTGSVVMLGLVMLIMDQQLPRQPLAPDLDMILKGIALAGIAPFFVFKQMTSGRVIGSGRPADPAQEQQRRLTQLIIGAALAELPLMVMLAYVALGGQLVWGLAAWAVSFGMMLALRPEGGRVI